MAPFGFGDDARTPPFVPQRGGVGTQQGGPLGILAAILGGGAPPTPQGPGLPRDPGIAGGAASPTFPAGRTPIGVAGAGEPVQPVAPQGGAPTGRPGGLQGVLLGLGDVAAGYRGEAQGPSQIYQQQRVAEYQRQRQEMLQNLQLAGQFATALERTPVGEVDAKRTKLREAFGKIAPGQEGLYDAVTSDVGLTPAMVEELSENEAVKLMLATGQLTAERVGELVQNPAFLEQVQTRSDQKALPGAVRKLNALRNSTDPRVREAVDAAGKDGIATFEEYLTLSDELGTDGPEGTKLTRAEADAVRRNQGVLEPKLPGIRSTDSYQAEVEAEAKLQRDIRLEREKAKGRVEAAAADKPQGYGARARDQAFAKNVYVPLVAEGGYGEIDRSLQELDAIIPRLEPETKTDSATGRVVGRIPRVLRPEESIDIERRVARIVQTDLRRILGGQFAQKEGEDLLARSYDRTLSEELNAKTLNDLRTAIRKEYAAKKAAAAYFEANNGSLEGYSGMKELEAGGATAASPPVGETRTVNGVTYQKVDGGWKKVTQ